MLFNRDKLYHLTKGIKLGTARPQPPFDELCQWLSSRLGIEILNIVHTKKLGGSQRLDVLAKLRKDWWAFLDGNHYDTKLETVIVAKLAEIVTRDQLKLKVDRIHVQYYDFETIAVDYADRQLTLKTVNQFSALLADSYLWRIYRCYGRVVFFFFTKTQAAQRMRDGSLERYSKLYFDLVKPYDECEYLREEDVRIEFESKENLDQAYGGSHYNFFR